jgi:2-keto-4-pentenoate hydratase
MDLIQAAAEHLAAARRAGTRGPRIPEAHRPGDIPAALAIQARVTSLLDWPIGGWKASAPAPGKIMRAPIYARDIRTGDRSPIVPVDGVAAIEPEIAFVLGRDLEPGAGPAQIRAAISETHLVLELIGSRFQHPDELTFPEKLGDCLNNQALLIGPLVTRPAGEWMSGFPITIPGVFEGQGKHPDGHPFVALEWLASQIPLTAGQIVTTGSFAGVIKAPLNQPLRVVFGDAGEIAVTFYPDSAA